MISKGVLFETFTGREEELALLAELREKTARQSEPSCVTITGEPGIGKSRLVHEFLKRSARLRGVAIEVACDSIVSTPYAALLMLLETAKDAARDFAPIDEACALLESVQRGVHRLDSDGESKLYHTVVTALQLYAARRGHLVLVIEDAHECDVASLAFFAMFVRRSKHSPIIFITTAREYGATEASGRVAALARIERVADYRITLEPLTIADIARSIETAVPQTTAEQVRALAKRSEGNPFFAEELARVSRDRNVQQPATLRAATIGRFDSLDSEYVPILQAAAVIGRDFDTALLYHIAPADERTVDAALRASREAGLIRLGSKGQQSFSHALFREALEESTPPLEAKRLHARIADSLESAATTRETLFAIAWHRTAAADTLKAIDANERAGDDAASINAHAEAAECYGRILAGASNDDAILLRVGPKAALSYATIGSFDRALQLVVELTGKFENAHDLKSARELLTQAIKWSISAGDNAAADRLIARAREFSEDALDVENRVEREIAIAWMSYSSSANIETLSILRAVQDLLSACSVALQLRFRNLRALANYAIGNVTAALDDLRLSMQQSEESNNVRGHLTITNNYCALSIEIGDASRVIARIAAALAVARSTDLVYAQSLLSITLMRAFLSIGDLPSATKTAWEALALDSPFPQWNADILAIAHYVAALTGNDGLAARASIDEAIDKAVSTALPICMNNVISLAARAKLKTDPKAARQLLDRLWVDKSFAASDPIIADCVGTVGSDDQIVFVRQELERNTRDAGNFAAPARLDSFDAAVAFRRNALIEGKAASVRAISRFEALGMPLDVAWCLEIQSSTREAEMWYERIGALAESRRLRGRSQQDIVYSEETLTGREEQVCRLIALGLTNREAAAKLSIGARTAETHLANAYRKLGVRTRAELAAYLGDKAAAFR